MIVIIFSRSSTIIPLPLSNLIQCAIFVQRRDQLIANIYSCYSVHRDNSKSRSSECI